MIRFFLYNCQCHFGQLITYHLKALGRQGPKEGPGSNLVGLHQVVIDKALVHVLHGLQDDALLGTPLLQLLQVQNLFLNRVAR